MRVLLRHTQTLKYYAAPDHWVAEEDEAYDFERPERAIHLARDNNLSGAELLVSFTDTGSRLTLPIQPPGRTAAYPQSYGWRLPHTLGPENLSQSRRQQ